MYLFGFLSYEPLVIAPRTNIGARNVNCGVSEIPAG
jgi:hypothetical protein